MRERESEREVIMIKNSWFRLNYLKENGSIRILINRVKVGLCVFSRMGGKHEPIRVRHVSIDVGLLLSNNGGPTSRWEKKAGS